MKRKIAIHVFKRLNTGGWIKNVWMEDREWMDGGMSGSRTEAVQRIFGRGGHQEEFHRRFLKKRAE